MIHSHPPIDALEPHNSLDHYRPKSAKLQYTIDKLTETLNQQRISGSYWNNALSYLIDYQKLMSQSAAIQSLPDVEGLEQALWYGSESRDKGYLNREQLALFVAAEHYANLKRKRND